MKNIKLRTLALCLTLIMVMASAAVASARVIIVSPAAGYCSNCGGTAFDNGFCAAEGCAGYEIPEQDANGTYQIGNAGQLYWFAAYVNAGITTANAVLIDDIKVNDSVLVNGALNTDSTVVASFLTWTPIGGESASYTGTFDGNNKTISGLYYCNTSYYPGVRYMGLFGHIGTDALIKNVNLTDTYFRCYSNIGGIVADSVGATVENCTVRVYLQGNIEVGDNGGVVGTNKNGTVTNCRNYGNVKGADRTGGVVGYNVNGKVEKCENHGTVDVYSTFASGDAGGVVGYNDAGTVTNCRNTGDVWGNRHIGGVVGMNNYGTVP